MTSFDDDEALAAEYVVGTLDSGERMAAEARCLRDPGFADLVRQWEQRLAPLAEATPALTPPADLLGRVLAQLPGDGAVSSWPTASNDNILIMRQQIRMWRGVATIAASLAALMALWIAGREARVLTRPDQTYVAVLQRGADQPAFVVSLDMANRRMAVLPLDTAAPPDKSYELWMIGGDQEPRSMGVVDSKTTLRSRLPNVDDATLSHATYAITVEPRGGSPNGKPSGPPMFVGKPNGMAL